MTLAGIGTDIVSVARIETVVTARGERFAARVLSAREQERYAAAGADRVAFLARRWAAKEAVAKALGTGIGERLRFRDISVVNDANGAPRVILEGRGAATAAARGIVAWHVSLSDERAYAVAFVVAEGEARTSG